MLDGRHGPFWEGWINPLQQGRPRVGCPPGGSGGTNGPIRRPGIVGVLTS